MPKIRFKLNSQDISRALSEVKKYHDDFPKKTEEIRKKVQAILTDLVKTGFNGAGYDDVLHEGMKVPDVTVYATDEGNISLVVADGKEAVFIEFGAGVYYNPDGAPHPARGQGIVAIGEYGYGYGKRKVWGYYDEEGNLKLTHGTPASMPMYHAIQEIVPRIPDICREVFRGGDAY